MTPALAQKPNFLDPKYELSKAVGAPAFLFAAGVLALREDVAILRGDHVVAVSNRVVALPDLIAGGDYAILLSDNGLEALRATDEAIGDSTVLGGFHFAPGGNATARAGGDNVPAINPCSIWDLEFRPACEDPRGMAYVAGVRGSEGVAPFWADIYLCGADHLEHGTSVFGSTIADGSDPPQKPGGSRYRKFDYATAKAVIAHHGKSLMSTAEFAAAAYGVSEKTTADRNPKVTGLDALRTSATGLMQATGNLYVWGHDGDPDEPRACLLGGYWVFGDWAGSRYAVVECWPGDSVEWIGARGRSDHLKHD